MRFILNLLFLNMWLIHIFKTPRLKQIVRVIPYILRVSHLLEKGGIILYLGKQIIKVLRSEGVSMEGFLDDISK